MIAVYFNLDFLAAFSFKQHSIDQTKLIHVANVKANTLDHAWMIVQHGSSDWTIKSEVEVLPGLDIAGPRSLSIGDVLEKDGERYQIGAVGFYKL